MYNFGISLFKFGVMVTFFAPLKFG